MSRAIGLALLVASLPLPALAAGNELGGAPLWRVFNFVIFVGAIVYFLRTPLRSFFADRRRDIEEELDTARSELERAESRLADCRRRLDELDREIESTRAAVRDQAEGEARRILEEAQTAAERIRHEAGAAVAQEVRRAKDALQAEAADLAVALAGDLLRERVEDGDRQRLFEQFVGRIEPTAPRPGAQS